MSSSKVVKSMSLLCSYGRADCEELKLISEMTDIIAYCNAVITTVTSK